MPRRITAQRLVVLGIGGRWSPKAAQFVRLTRSRACSAPLVLRFGATAAYVFCWSALLSFAAARAVAASLLTFPLGHAANVDERALDLTDVLRSLLCSTAGQHNAPAGLAVSCAFFPVVDVSCLGLLQLATGRLGVRPASHWGRGLAGKGATKKRSQLP